MKTTHIIYVKLLCWLNKAVDISSNRKFPAGALSNFMPYEFTFRGFKCASMEGLLQGLKFENAEKQAKVFQMVGKNAKFIGKRRKWWLDQKLYWQGKPIDRESEEYLTLVKEAFHALATNPDFRLALLATGNKRLFHTIGKQIQQETILTEKEFCMILTEIRAELQMLMNDF